MMSLPIRALFAVSARQMRPARTVSASAPVLGFFRLMRLEIRNGHGIWFALAAMALSLWWVTLYSDEPRVALWPHWSMYAAQSFGILGTVMAAWSAWVASNEHHHRVDRTSSQAALPAWARELVPMASGLFIALTSYVIICALLLGYAATRATWGGPDWLVIAYGAVATLAFCALGAMAGRRLPYRWVVAVVFAALVAHIVSSFDLLDTASPYQSYAYVSYPWDRVEHFHELNGTVNGLHLDGGVAIGAGLIVAALADLLRRQRAVMMLCAVLAATLIVGGWAAAGRDAESYHSGPSAAIENPDMVCSGEVIEVCMHQAYAETQQTLSEQVNRLLAPVAGLEGVPTTITQRPSQGMSDPGVLADAGDRLLHLGFPLMERLFGGDLSGVGGMSIDSAQIAILVWMMEQAELAPLLFMYVNSDAGIDPWSAAIRDGSVLTDHDVARWEARQDRLQVDVDAAADRFAMLSPDEQRAWLVANWDALRAGELTLEELP